MNQYYIEITPYKVKQISPQLTKQINEGLKQNKDKIFVRVTEIGGHCINLGQLSLLNTINGKTRQIYTSIPKGMELITDQMSQLSPQIPPSTIHIPMIWYQKIGKNFRKLQLSISDQIERFYNYYISGKNSTIYEFKWQQYRFIVDFINMTLENCNTLELTHIQRKCPKTNTQYHVQQNDSFDYQMVQWQYNKYGDIWENYDQNNNKILEKQYKKYCKHPDDIKKSTCLKVIKKTTLYYIDFIKFIEYSPIDKGFKTIRRICQNQDIQFEDQKFQ